MSAQPNPPEIASAWLATFGAALTSADVSATTACFHGHGYLRDILVFTWSNRTLQGQEKITAYLADTLCKAAISAVKLDVRAHLTPAFMAMAGSVVLGFTFDTAVGPAQGYAFLNPAPSGEWKALCVFVTLVDIRGHEESGPELGVYGGHTLAWEDVDRARRTKIEADPYVLIIGGGQTGLNVAARFKQMNIPALIVERTARVGDVWRQRYPTLTLHSVRAQHAMLYQSYPKNWPLFTSRDKLAQWLEQYADSEDLIVWKSSQVLPTPTFDPSTKRWTAVVERSGTRITLHPAHIVIAAGTLGSPYYPPMSAPERFRGKILHAGTYMGGAPFAGQRVVVVGAGNSAADVCQDLVFHGAASVTMVQRSSTCVMAVAHAQEAQQRFWPEDVPTDVADFKLNAMPTLLMRKILQAQEKAGWEAEKETHRGLREAGFELNMGVQGAGAYLLMFERFGGFFLDVGCAALIRDGQVKIKHGVEPTSYTEDSVVFTDGSALPADTVIFATSYHSIRDDLRPLFGDAVIDATSPLWGLDDEGELRGCYRASGYPGLWFAAGNFPVSRFFSKQLALEIKGLELGLYEQ
ncbi:FAD/NAD-P-binding domain-containing protein [Mycena belliarum]|uniref:FAD/NAD-P-binding domain-containing protein n=1 Tax=Mycena belliarum TaxID=1033014 RepID=A0AAD6UCX7_9AGAR|nr:FAD/NAD-P-binding domain-containing protein [Mycena belliae]